MAGSQLLLARSDMSQLQDSVQELIAASAASRGPEILQPLAQRTSNLRANATASDLEAAVAALAANIRIERPVGSGWLALTAGCFVEVGAPSAALLEALLLGLPSLLEPAGRFAREARRMALSPDESKQLSKTAGGLWLGDSFLPPERLQAAIWQNEAGYVALQAVDSWSRPTMACIGPSPAARARARSILRIDPTLATVRGAAGWLAKMLSVLDDEPFLVLHPGVGLGFRLNVSGVADNFQLHTLLADLLTGDLSEWPIAAPKLPGKRPSPAVAAVAKGTGPQQIKDLSVGTWNLYLWTAVQPAGHLPEVVPSEDWIWGEGIPADIRVFEGFRVILLGAPSYHRGWQTARRFASMAPRLLLEETLDAEAVSHWMRRFGQTARP